MVVFGTTTIFFSPSLYFSVISSPSTPFTICATVAFVIVLFGIRSHGRCPSPVPRKASGKMWISTAFWLPSACGMPVTPMNECCLISESEALTTPRTATLSAILTLCIVWPSGDLTVSISPSASSTVPRTRTVDDRCWAKVVDVASSRTTPAAPNARRVIWSIVILRTPLADECSATESTTLPSHACSNASRRNLQPLATRTPRARLVGVRTGRIRWSRSTPRNNGVNIVDENLKLDPDSPKSYLIIRYLLLLTHLLPSVLKKMAPSAGAICESIAGFQEAAFVLTDLGTRLRRPRSGSSPSAHQGFSVGGCGGSVGRPRSSTIIRTLRSPYRVYSRQASEP